MPWIGLENEILLTITEKLWVGLYRPAYYLKRTQVLSLTSHELER